MWWEGLVVPEALCCQLPLLLLGVCLALPAFGWQAYTAPLGLKVV